MSASGSGAPRVRLDGVFLGGLMWVDRDALREAIEALEDTMHAGAPVNPSKFRCFANVDEVVDLLWPELERLMLPNGVWRVACTDGEMSAVRVARVQIGTKRVDPPMWIEMPGGERPMTRGQGFGA